MKDCWIVFVSRLRNGIQGIYKVFRLVQGKLLLIGRLLKSRYKLISFGALCNLMAKMHNTSKVW